VTPESVWVRVKVGYARVVKGKGGSEARPVDRVAGFSIFSWTLDDECILERKTS